MKKNLALVQQLTIDTEVLENINDCLNITFGPTGKTGLSFTKKQNFKFLTNGSLLIKSLEFSRNSKNLLLRLLEQAVLKTYTISGDGSSLTLLFTCEFLKNSFRYILSGYNSIFISNGLKKIAIFLNEKNFRIFNAYFNKRKFIWFS